MVAFVLGLAAAALGFDERKATLAIVAVYGVFYGALQLVRRYRETHSA
jgi:hypothetical protein